MAATTSYCSAGPLRPSECEREGGGWGVGVCVCGPSHPLIGGSSTPHPLSSPDFYLLWLFKQTVRQGARALNTTLSAPSLLSGLFMYAVDAKAGATVTLVIVNVHKLNTYYIDLEGPAVGGARTEFHLTGDVIIPHAPVFVNGRALKGDLPPIASLGVPGAAGSVLAVAPASIVFVTV